MVTSAYTQDKKIMIVSNALPDADAIIQKFMTEINGVEGFVATHIPMADLGTTTFANFDAAIITENGGSGSMAAFGSAGWPLPVVHLKSYSLYQGTNPLFPQALFLISDRPSTLIPGITDIKVIDNADILKCYKADSILKWTNGYNTTIGTGAGEAHIQVYDLKDATANASVSQNASLLAETEAVDVNLTHKKNFWKVEANAVTKRTVTWGIHHDFLEHATDDFWAIIKNAVLWSLGKEADIKCGTTGFKDIASARFQVYPNPVADNLNINSAGLISKVSLVDITGKTVMEIMDLKDQHVKINMSNLSKGIYIVHVTTFDSETFTGKVTK